MSKPTAPRSFRPGERIRAFGISDGDGWYESVDGTVTRTQEHPVRRLWFKEDGTGDEMMAVPGQCRRLRKRPKPKAPREYWLVRNPRTGELGVRYATPKMDGDEPPAEVIRVREVVEKPPRARGKS